MYNLRSEENLLLNSPMSLERGTAMQIQVSRGGDLPQIPLTPAEFEQAVARALYESVDFFKENDIRFGPDGLYMKIGPNVFIFDMEIKFRRVMKPAEKVPVDFCQT